MFYLNKAKMSFVLFIANVQLKEHMFYQIKRIVEGTHFLSKRTIEITHALSKPNCAVERTCILLKKSYVCA